MDELEILIRNYRPKFGDSQSIFIARKVAEFRRLTKELGDHKKTVKALDRAVKKKTMKERDLERCVQYLLGALRT